MPSDKRENARIERRLVATLTDACETAKAEIDGFEWLTHEANPEAFERTLQVIWVFDTQAGKERALSRGQDARMRELTVAALEDAGVSLNQPERRVHFDSEEECNLRHGGDWRVRLNRFRTARG